MKRYALKTTVCSALILAFAVSAGSVGAAAAENNELPGYYSSRDLGYVTPVKSQFRSTCWAYAGLATYESLLLRNGIEIGEMSAAHLNIWSTPHEDGTGWSRSIYGDGYPKIALGYFTSWQGGVLIPEGGDFPLDESETSDDIPTDLARYGVTSVKYLTNSDRDTIKRCIIDYGGVYTSYCHSLACFNKGSDKVSYYMPKDYSGGAGHSVEVVGWDDDYPLENFNGNDGSLPQNNGAWLIKNSHGSSFNSMGGYFWMSYEDAWVFSSRYTPSYALTGFEEITEDKKLIQNEIYGATYDFGYIPEKTQTFINRFSFDENYNTIDKIVFSTKAAGAEYSIYYVPDNDNDIPDPNTDTWTLLGSGTVDYAGYICTDIEDFKYPNAEGSIAVKIDATQTDMTATIGVDEWLTNSSEFIFKPCSKRGESFMLQNGQAVDLMDWYKSNENDDIGGTFVIKALTVKTYEPTLLGDADLDGKVIINDVTEIQRHLAEFITLSKEASANADYNRDGVINIEDCTQIQQMLAEYVG